jgi:hypothetical protein
MYTTVAMAQTAHPVARLRVRNDMPGEVNKPHRVTTTFFMNVAPCVATWNW